MTESTIGTIGVDDRLISDRSKSVEGRLDTVLVKTASRCNIDCSYCYVYRGPDSSWRLQPKRMCRQTAEVLCKRLIEHARRQQEAGFAIVLHGGEPLLLGYSGLALILRGLRASLVPERYPISVQTNGTLISGKLLDLFAETRTSLSVSIDGPPHVNDLARLSHRGESTYAATIQGIRLLASHPDSEFLFAGTLSVIQPDVDAKIIYRFLKKLGSPSMDFLLQDGNHDRMPAGKAHFSSMEYGQWLNSLFDLYLSDPSPVP
ncbi:MAG: radical SAM protein, partial [Gemmatimonadetes bacterium]|nr:radical SAM protein [Gemmatimonadota bacterium]